MCIRDRNAAGRLFATTILDTLTSDGTFTHQHITHRKPRASPSMQTLKMRLRVPLCIRLQARSQKYAVTKHVEDMGPPYDNMEGQMKMSYSEVVFENKLVMTQGNNCGQVQFVALIVVRAGNVDKGRVKMAAESARFWDDAVYSQFYDNSRPEQMLSRRHARAG
eukprot:6483315-Amphidinium_carterae.1